MNWAVLDTHDAFKELAETTTREAAEAERDRLEQIWMLEVRRRQTSGGPWIAQQPRYTVAAIEADGMVPGAYDDRG